MVVYRNLFKKTIIFVFILFSFCGCSNQNETITYPNDVKEYIDVNEYYEALCFVQENYSNKTELKDQIVMDWKDYILSNGCDADMFNNFSKVTLSKDKINKYFEECKKYYENNTVNVKLLSSLMYCLYHNEIDFKSLNKYEEYEKLLDDIGIDYIKILFDNYETCNFSKMDFVNANLLYERIKDKDNVENIIWEGAKKYCINTNKSLKGTKLLNYVSGIRCNISDERINDLIYMFYDVDNLIFEGSGLGRNFKDLYFYYVIKNNVDASKFRQFLKSHNLESSYFEEDIRKIVEKADFEITIDHLKTIMNLFTDDNGNYLKNEFTHGLRMQIENHILSLEPNPEINRTSYSLQCLRQNYVHWEFAIKDDCLYKFISDNPTNYNCNFPVYYGNLVNALAYAIDDTYYFVTTDGVYQFWKPRYINELKRYEYNDENPYHIRKVLNQKDIVMIQVVNDYLECLLKDNTLIKYNMKNKTIEKKKFVSWDDATIWANGKIIEMPYE